jgi:hypothetical protein
MNQIFQLNRFIDLIKYRIVLHRKVWLMQAGAFLGIALIISGLFFADEGIDNNTYIFIPFYNLFYFLLLILTGIYLASRSFVEYKATSSAFSYMMLPASTFEKFLIPAFFSGIFYYYAFSLFYMLVAWFTNVFWGMIYGYEFYFFNPFITSPNTPSQFNFIFFMLLQPLFLFGAIALRKNHFIITGLTIFTFIIVCVLLVILLVKLRAEPSRTFNFNITDKDFQRPIAYVIALVIHCILQVAVFFKLKEKEV